MSQTSEQLEKKGEEDKKRVETADAAVNVPSTYLLSEEAKQSQKNVTRIWNCSSILTLC